MVRTCLRRHPWDRPGNAACPEIEQAIRWYAMRWSVDVAFHDSKRSLSLEQPWGGATDE